MKMEKLPLVNDIGDVVQSFEVYNNKLFVIVNNSHKIIAYDITEDGLSLPELRFLLMVQVHVKW